MPSFKEANQVRLSHLTAITMKNLTNGTPCGDAWSSDCHHVSSGHHCKWLDYKRNLSKIKKLQSRFIILSISDIGVGLLKLPYLGLHTVCITFFTCSPWILYLTFIICYLLSVICFFFLFLYCCDNYCSGQTTCYKDEPQMQKICCSRKNEDLCSILLFCNHWIYVFLYLLNFFFSIINRMFVRRSNWAYYRYCCLYILVILCS